MARGSLATQRRAYHDEVIDHYENPRNVGKSSGQYRRREGDKKGPCGTVGSLTDGGKCTKGEGVLLLGLKLRVARVIAVVGYIKAPWRHTPLLTPSSATPFLTFACVSRLARPSLPNLPPPPQDRWTVTLMMWGRVWWARRRAGT